MIDEEITLKKLEVFLAFMRLHSLARVSEELGQSTVSVHRALHSLEEGLRCPLFRREGRNLAPLPAAYAFAKHAQRAVSETEEGVRKVRELAGFAGGRLKIGSLYSLTLRCIPQLLMGLKLRRPELQIDLTLGSNQELLRGLDEGRLDAIVIGLQAPLDDAQLLAVPLFEDEVYLAAPLGSPYAGRSHVDLRDLHERAGEEVRLFLVVPLEDDAVAAGQQQLQRLDDAVAVQHGTVGEVAGRRHPARLVAAPRIPLARGGRVAFHVVSFVRTVTPA